MAAYFRFFLGHRFASTKAAAGKTEGFVRAIKEFVEREEIELVRFGKGVRKDEVVKKHLRKFGEKEGVLFVGVAQEKARAILGSFCFCAAARSKKTHDWS